MKVVPRPRSEAMSTVPPMSSILVLTTSMPTPRPETAVTAFAVEKPGWKMNFATWASLMRSSSASAASPRSRALRRIAAKIEPAAVVGDLDRDRAALVVGGEADRAALGLAGGAALERALDAVIGGVADHVGERILDELEHLAVELGLGALHDELDLLRELRREVAHDPRQLLPGGADRLHARLHDAFLQLGGDVREALQRHLVAAVVLAPGDLEELVAGQHQLRDHGHQMLERVDVDADRLHLGRRRAVGRLGIGSAQLQPRPFRRRSPAPGQAVARKARSRSSSETSPGFSARSRT